jgi:hypothetical protein
LCAIVTGPEHKTSTDSITRWMARRFLEFFLAQFLNSAMNHGG